MTTSIKAALGNDHTQLQLAKIRSSANTNTHNIQFNGNILSGFTVMVYKFGWNYNFHSIYCYRQTHFMIKVYNIIIYTS